MLRQAQSEAPSACTGPGRVDLLNRFSTLIILVLGLILVDIIASFPQTTVIEGRGLVVDSRDPDLQLSSAKESFETNRLPSKDLSMTCRLFFYSTDLHQTVFQTADEKLGVRVEVQPPGLLRVSIGTGMNIWMKSCIVTKNLQPERWYDFSLYVSKNKEARVSFDNTQHVLPKQDDTFYSISHILFGRVDGKVADIEIRYRYWNNFLLIQTILLVLITTLVCRHIRRGQSNGATMEPFPEAAGEPISFHNPIFLRLVFSFFTALLAMMLVFLIIHLFCDPPTVAPPRGLRQDSLPFLSPEPKERLQYIVLLLAAPFVALGSHHLFRKFSLRASRCGSLLAVFGGILFLMLLGYTGLKEADFLYLGRTSAFEHPWFIVLGPAFILFLLWWESGQAQRNPYAGVHRRAFHLMLGAFAGTLVLFTVISRTFHHHVLGGTVAYHFEAVFYSVSQVVQGRTLLVDLYNQYGLYPHFLEPIFRLFGISTVLFTLVMGVLSGAALFLLYSSLRKTMKQEVFAFLGMTLVFIHNYSPASTPVFDPYFQNSPIRTLFPLGLFFLTMTYFSTGRRAWYAATLLGAASGILWNQDTGIIVFMSVMLTFLYRDLCHESLRKALVSFLVHLLLGLIAVATCLGAFAVFAYLRSASWPRFEDYFLYQRIFYEAGYGCLPMKPLHPWNMVAVVYVGAMIYAVHRWRSRNASIKTYAVVYLALLGCGIFSYFQGRSHDLNLIPVVYPAILILTFFAHELWESLNRSGVFCLSKAVSFSLILVFLGYILLAFIGGQGRFAGDIRRGTDSLHHTWCTIDEYLHFIRSHTRPGERIFIDSGTNMGVLYAETKTANPLVTPGFVEGVLQEDLDKNLDFLEMDANTKIFVDMENLEYFLRLRRSALYRIEDMSRSARMLLVKKVEGETNRSGRVLSYDPPAPIDERSPSFLLFPHLPYDFDFSLEMTFMAGGDPQMNSCLFSNTAEGSDDWGVSLVHQNGQMHYFVSGPRGKGWMSKPFSTVPGSWHRVKIVWRKGAYSFYHNEHLLDSISLPENAKTSILPLVIRKGADLAAPFNVNIRSISLQIPHSRPG